MAVPYHVSNGEREPIASLRYSDRWKLKIPNCTNVPVDAAKKKWNKHSFEVVTRLRLWSSVSNRGTHLADSFLMSKYSCKMWCTRSVEMPTASATSHTFILLSSNIIPWILSTISGVMTSFGRPERLASLVLVRPQRNSVNHFLSIEIDGAEFP